MSYDLMNACNITKDSVLTIDRYQYSTVCKFPISKRDKSLDDAQLSDVAGKKVAKR